MRGHQLPHNLLRHMTLRSQCDRRLGDIPVPQPFDLDEFAGTLTQYRGRELRFDSFHGNPGTALTTGAWIATVDADYVYIDAEAAAASPWHRNLIALHEVGHILCDHESDMTFTALAAMLTPHLDQRMVRRCLGRHGYSHQDEREAETIASLILERADADPVPVTASGPDGVTARLAHTLRHPVRRPR